MYDPSAGGAERADRAHVCVRWCGGGEDRGVGVGFWTGW